MREAALLELNGVQVGIVVTQHSFLDVMDEGVKLGFEYMHHQVRTVRGRLALKECILDLRPGRVGSHGDEEMRPS